MTTTCASSATASARGLSSTTGWRSDYERHLADAYHAIKTGRVLKRHDTLDSKQRVYWRMVTARDAGLFMGVPLPELPPDAGEDLRRGRDLFGMMCARWLSTDGSDQTPLSQRLVAGFLGITRDQARAVIEGLLDAGVIELHHREQPSRATGTA